MLHTLTDGKVSLCIDPSEGMNVTGLSFDGKNIVVCDHKRKENGATYAIPVLFPTPNRTENLTYSYNGEQIPAVMHGFLRHREFSLDRQTDRFLSGHCDFDATDPLFPYRGRMTICIEVTDDSVRWSFSFLNLSDRTVAYNLALHPFFSKEGLKTVQVDVEKEMLNTEDKLPTGKTIPVPPIAMPAEDVDMDTVFIMAKKFRANLEYDLFTVHFSASEDFRHAVVYSSPDKPFMCIEPQTGSTDAHNLHRRGFCSEAALIEVTPGSHHESWFCLRFNNSKQ